MSEPYVDDVDEDDDSDQDAPTNEARLSLKDLRALRKKARQYDELAVKQGQLEREMAFAKAKLDLDDPRIGYFVKAYDGELTSEAIRAKAEEVGFIRAQQQEAPPSSEVQAHQRFVQASQGAGDVMNVKLEDAIAQAKTAEEVLELMERAGFPTTRTSQ